MEPIFFRPTYKNVIWGGTNIAKIFKRKVEGDDIGESWELSAHPNGLSQIENESFGNISLLELFNDKSRRKEIFGTNCEKLEKFPILAKFIDANDKLSIQVHPDDEYARKNENDSGKNEVWYVMDCKDGAKIIYGFKDDITKGNLTKAVENIENNVRFVEVHKGDFISIPAGTIHAILDGIVICEVQQSCDVTYRVYDWNRVGKDGKPRETHVQKALDVINLENRQEIHNYNDITSNTKLYRSNIFNIDIVINNEREEHISKEDSFYAYIVLEGDGTIQTSNYEKSISKGSTFLIPATLGKYIITGNLKMMKIWV